MHGSSTLSEAIHSGNPLDIRQSTDSVPQQSAGVVVPGLDEPVGLTDEVLVVGVVEQVAAPHRPHVLQQGVGGVHPAQRVGAQDGHRLPACEAKLGLEEVEGVVSVPLRVRVSLRPTGSVLDGVLSHTVSSAELELDLPGQSSLAVLRPLVPHAVRGRPHVGARPVVRVVLALVVVLLHGELHRHLGGVGPEVRPDS